MALGYCIRRPRTPFATRLRKNTALHAAACARSHSHGHTRTRAPRSQRSLQVHLNAYCRLLCAFGGGRAPVNYCERLRQCTISMQFLRLMSRRSRRRGQPASASITSILSQNDFNKFAYCRPTPTQLFSFRSRIVRASSALPAAHSSIVRP